MLLEFQHHQLDIVVFVVYHFYILQILQIGLLMHLLSLFHALCPRRSVVYQVFLFPFVDMVLFEGEVQVANALVDLLGFVFLAKR